MKVIEESLSLTGDQATLLALLHRGQTPPGLDPGQHGQPEVLCRGSRHGVIRLTYLLSAIQTIYQIKKNKEEWYYVDYYNNHIRSHLAVIEFE